MLAFPRTLARRSRWGPGRHAAAAAAAFSTLRSKSELLDEIMAWRTAFVEREGGRNPTQDDIVADEAGAALLREWQAVEAHEGGAGSSIIDGAERVEAVDPAIEAKKAEVKTQLLAWRTEFEREQGRKPTRDDMFGDAEAAELFARFQSYTELDWPAEMRLLLNADLTPPQ